MRFDFFRNIGAILQHYVIGELQDTYMRVTKGRDPVAVEVARIELMLKDPGCSDSLVVARVSANLGEIQGRETHLKRLVYVLTEAAKTRPGVATFLEKTPAPARG
jgi:hypothetical protein